MSRRRTGLRMVVAIAGVAIAATGIARLLAGDDVDPQGFAVLDRPQSAADRQVYSALVGKVVHERIRREDVRLLASDGDHSAALFPVRRNGLRDSDRRSSSRFTQICLSYGGEFGFVSCADHRELLRGGLSGSGSSEVTDPSDRAPRTPPPTHFYGVVPNAVARIEVTFSGRVPSVTADVKDNFYDAVSTNPDASNRVGDTKWFDEDGRAVRH